MDVIGVAGPGMQGAQLTTPYWGIPTDLVAQFASDASFMVNAGREIIWNETVTSPPDPPYRHLFQKDDYRININAQNLAAGIYYVEVYSKEQRFTSKISIQK
jgi:hypothetical protein